MNGVVLFNQDAAGRVPLINEILSVDCYNGHPSPSNEYHYHVEPLWLTQSRGKGFRQCCRRQPERRRSSPRAGTPFRRQRGRRLRRPHQITSER